MAIAEASTPWGSCHPHIAELAGMSHLSPSTVFVAIKALRRRRWILTDRVTGQESFLIFQIDVPKLRRSISLIVAKQFQLTSTAGADPYSSLVMCSWVYGGKERGAPFTVRD
jgi:hypothetical protein